jgi:hypothetical protein
MLDGQNVNQPILQIIQMKNIQNNMDGMTRYKVTLFDGEIQHTCKLIFLWIYINNISKINRFCLKLVY